MKCVTARRVSETSAERQRGLMGCRACPAPSHSRSLALLLTAGTASAAGRQPTALPAAPGSEAEPNDTPATATPIEPGERIRAPRTSGDVDHYRFTAEAGDRVFATVMTAGSTVAGLEAGAARLGRHDGARDRR